MTIYIRPDGTISGSNEPLPVKPKEEWTDSIHNYGGYVYGYGIAMKNYGNALTAWNESCKDFEDQKHVMSLLPDSAFSHTNRRGGLIPDTIIENVDVETEVVDQLKTVLGSWVDCYGGRKPEIEEINPVLEYRTVLRIKDKP